MKRVIPFFLASVMIFSLCGCAKINYEVDDYAYVIAVGVDKGDSDNLKITLSFANPNAIGGGSESGSKSAGEGNDNLINFTVESSGIFNALNVANDNISKMVNLSHVKLILFSKEIAVGGIKEYIEGFTRELSVRPATIVAVCDNSCEDYLKSITPKLEVNPEKYINDLFDKNKTTFLAKATLSDFFLWGRSKSKDVTAAYLGTQGEAKSNRYSEDKNEYSYSVDDNKTGDVPISTENKSVTLGTAFFDGYHLAGMGTNIENLYMQLLIGEASEVVYSIKDSKKSITEVSLSQNEKPRYEVDVSGAKPKVKIKIRLEADVMSIGDIRVDKNTYKELEKKLKKALTKELNTYMYKIVKDLKVDSIGIGNYAKSRFLTWQEWEEYDWKKKYPDLQYKIEVDANIVKFGLLDKSLNIGERRD